MSAPISAIRSCAVVTPKPGMASSWAICRSQGWQRAAIRTSSSPIWPVRWSMLRSIIDRMKACSGVKKEQSRASASRESLPRILPWASPARAAGFRSPLMMAFSMARPETPWIVTRHPS